MAEYTNDLINEKSPYLLRHAHNPVDWHSWSEKSLKMAETQDKPLIISIGYSACHWCHVMEEESFSDLDVAAIMNSRFLCIKVDREERPDIDYHYMEAVKLLTGSGGWPLNCFTLPDGRPVLGGTYFPKDQWKNLLIGISDLYKQNKEKLVSQADAIENKRSELELEQTKRPESSLQKEELTVAVNNLKGVFDTENGGFTSAPKFPMPGMWRFLLRYSFHKGDSAIRNHTLFTLEKIIKGGIFDHAGGGFARYSVDEKWLVPHFEKMLYDNAQLLELYAEAYQLEGSNHFKKAVEKTFTFLLEDLGAAEGGFYSSLDADSEGIEGRYYTWTFRELEKILQNSPGKETFYRTFGISEEGNWGSGYNILHRTTYNQEEEEAVIENILKTLRSERKKRPKPGLDNKIIAGWNGLVISGLLSAYRAFQTPVYRETAEICAEFICNNMMENDDTLFRIFVEGERQIPAFLEDYAPVIRGFLDLYETSGKELWFHRAKILCEKVQDSFSSSGTPLFNFTPSGDGKSYAADALGAGRYKETTDTVIPSSNGLMADNLFRTARILGNPESEKRSRKMTKHMFQSFVKNPSFHYQWGNAALNMIFPFYETVITGPQSNKAAETIMRTYLPHSILCRAAAPSTIPIIKNRWNPKETRIFICRDKTCLKPIAGAEEAVAILYSR